MNNDLISISEAKKLGATCLARRNENGQLEAIISLDNAETVDLWKMRQEATENALKKAEVLYTRPQGEWLHNSDRPDRLICSVCDCEWDMWRYESKELKYCPNCGAQMTQSKMPKENDND